MITREKYRRKGILSWWDTSESPEEVAMQLGEAIEEMKKNPGPETFAAVDKAVEEVRAHIKRRNPFRQTFW